MDSVTLKPSHALPSHPQKTYHILCIESSIKQEYISTSTNDYQASMRLSQSWVHEKPTTRYLFIAISYFDNEGFYQRQEYVYQSVNGKFLFKCLTP